MMGYFGIGMANGVLNGFRVGHEMKMDELNHLRDLKKDARREKLVDLQTQQAEQELKRQQRQQDLQDAALILPALANGQADDKLLQKYSEIAQRQPLLSLDELLSPRTEAALNVAKSIRSPEDLQDPNKIAASNWLLTMGNDTDYFKSVQLNPQNPSTLLATDKYGGQKEIPVEAVQNHIKGIEQMRQALGDPQVQRRLAQYRNTLFPKARQETPTLQTVYDEKTGRERKAYLGPDGKLVYVGGVKAETKPKGGKTGKTPDYAKMAVDLLKGDDAYYAADPEGRKKMLLDTIAMLKQGYGLPGASQKQGPAAADDKEIMAIFMGGEKKAQDKQPQPSTKRGLGIPFDPVRKYNDLSNIIEKEIEHRGTVEPGTARAWIKKLKSLGDVGYKNYSRERLIATLKKFAGA